MSNQYYEAGQDLYMQSFCLTKASHQQLKHLCGHTFFCKEGKICFKSFYQNIFFWFSCDEGRVKSPGRLITEFLPPQGYR